jgi:hypothetical protein
MGMVGYMNGVLVDLAQARSALQVAAGHAAELIRSLPDPLAPVPGLEWTVGQTAAHMVAAPMNYLCYATGQAEPEATIDLRAGNLERIERVGREDLSELADLLVEETDRYLNGTGDLSDDHPVPFFGETTVSLAAQTGIMLGEYVVHGRDLARSAGRPSRLDPSDAILVIAAITAVIPRYLNRETAPVSMSPTRYAFAVVPGSSSAWRATRQPSSRARVSPWTAGSPLTPSLSSW